MIEISSKNCQISDVSQVIEVDDIFTRMDGITDPSGGNQEKEWRPSITPRVQFLTNNEIMGISIWLGLPLRLHENAVSSVVHSELTKSST